MGSFKIAREDRVEAVAYASEYSAQSVLNGLDPSVEYSTITLYEDERDAYSYSGSVYKVTIVIEPV